MAACNCIQTTFLTTSPPTTAYHARCFGQPTDRSVSQIPGVGYIPEIDILLVITRERGRGCLRLFPTCCMVELNLTQRSSTIEAAAAFTVLEAPHVV